MVQLVAKNGKREFSYCKFGFVHLSIKCLLDNTYQVIFKNVIEFDHNSNLFLVRRFHTMKKL
jgi:hypothetical protein